MIDERLKSLTKYVNRNNKIIDIGCDHALLDIYLVKNNIVNKVIVSDVSKNALMQGINNINKYNLSDKIYARCGSGLEVLNSNDDIDTVIISGMGSNTIIDIKTSVNCLLEEICLAYAAFRDTHFVVSAEMTINISQTKHNQFRIISDVELGHQTNNTT